MESKFRFFRQARWKCLHSAVLITIRTWQMFRRTFSSAFSTLITLLFRLVFYFIRNMTLFPFLFDFFICSFTIDVHLMTHFCFYFVFLLPSTKSIDSISVFIEKWISKWIAIREHMVSKFCICYRISSLYLSAVDSIVCDAPIKLNHTEKHSNDKHSIENLPHVELKEIERKRKRKGKNVDFLWKSNNTFLIT